MNFLATTFTDTTFTNMLCDAHTRHFVETRSLHRQHTDFLYGRLLARPIVQNACRRASSTRASTRASERASARTSTRASERISVRALVQASTRASARISVRASTRTSARASTRASTRTSARTSARASTRASARASARTLSYAHLPTGRARVRRTDTWISGGAGCELAVRTNYRPNGFTTSRPSG